MAAEDSLKRSMDKAVKHYSSLFKLPPYRKVVLSLALICTCVGLLSSFALFKSFQGLADGFSLGFSLFFITLVLDYISSVFILRQDPLYDMRRTAALSLFCWVLWLLFIVVGVAAALYFNSAWSVKLCLLGFSAVLIFRLIVFGSTSSVNFKKFLLASLIQPLSWIAFFLLFWAKIGYNVSPQILFFLILSLIVGLSSSFSFLTLLNSVGKQTLGVPSLSIFRAFLLNWVVDLNAPFEDFLEKLSEAQNVEVSLIKFGSFKPKAIIVVPSVHPGPFKNIGSSLLPSMLKTILEEKLNCIACVPHGLFGHEFDLASQLQSQKLVESVIESVGFEVSESKATPFIKVSKNSATACCQIFGNFALLSFTLAPGTTEDFPQELGLFVRQEAEKRRLSCCVIVNAHNSINGPVSVQEALEALKTVAVACLEKCVSLRKFPFEVGAATVFPERFGSRDGMGPGGITVIVVKVGEQKTAYVVIDGNNMISGLRDKILSCLYSIGIEEGEVFTTDSHSVNAVVVGGRGYHPVGEVMDHEILIGYIKEATVSALSNLEPVKVACRDITVSGIKVIGIKPLEALCLLVDKTLQKAKKIVVPIFAFTWLILMLILATF